MSDIAEADTDGSGRITAQEETSRRPTAEAAAWLPPAAFRQLCIENQEQMAQLSDTSFEFHQN